MGTEFIGKMNKYLSSQAELEDLEFSIHKFQLLKKNNILRILIKSDKNISKEQENFIKKYILETLQMNIDIEIICYIDASSLSLDEIINKYWLDIVQTIINKHPILKGILMDSKRNIEKNYIEISSGINFLCEFIKKKKIEEEIVDKIKTLFGINVKINFKYNESLKIEDYEKIKLNENLKIVQNALSNTQIKNEISKPKEVKKEDKKPKYTYEDRKSEPKSENNILGRNIKDDPVLIESINDTSGIVTVVGEVFKTEIFETKTGRIILTFFITDYSSSISVKCFMKPKDQETVLENIKKGLYCKVRGEAIMDPYAKEVVIMARDVFKMTKTERMDTSEEKRVELHLHTNMSSMDGITSVGKIIEKAAKFGHKAIAITDHGVVQAFPDAQIAAKKNNIKVIYGVEGYLVDNGTPIVINENDAKFSDEFVVFDIETTGFSSKNDKIIEIGAVKIKGYEIIDRFSCFVNPQDSIPYKITELTGITDEMVENEPTIDKILPEFIKFIGESVIVAHNANFDMSFINKNIQNLKFDKLTNPIMDTVPLARFLYPELKRVKLNTVAKHLGVSLENHHRAVDDAKATADILLISLKKLEEEKKIYDIKSLNKEFLNNVDIKKQPTYHIIILAKNQVGLKNLYKLISKAHLDYFFKRPRLPKSIISEYKEGLIIGAACEAGQVYKAVLEGKSDDEIKEIASFYDYL